MTMSILTAERLEEIRAWSQGDGLDDRNLKACLFVRELLAALTPPAEGEVAMCVSHLRNATEWHAYTSFDATGGGGHSQECKSPFIAADLLTRLCAECARVKAMHAEAFRIGIAHQEAAKAAERERDEARTKALEEAAMAASKVLEMPNDCDSLGPMDMETGVSECALESRGGDCLCAERFEEAERIVIAIRALSTIKEPKA